MKLQKEEIIYIIRSIPFIILLMNYFVYYIFSKWMKTSFINKKYHKKIRIIYHVLILIFILPWIMLLFGGNQQLYTFYEWIKLYYLYPSYAWQLTHVVMFFILLVYMPVKLLVQGVNWVVSKPEPINESKRSWLKQSLITVPTLIFSVNLIGVYSSEFDWIVNKIKIKIKDLPEKLKGVTITQISDCHFGIYMDGERFDKFVPFINDLKSDIIVITGDTIHSSIKILPEAIKSISQLEAKHGIYSCLGNHEHISNASLIVNQFQKKSPVDFIINDLRTVQINESELHLMGIDYLRRKSFSFDLSMAKDMIHHLYKKIEKKEGPKVLLAHHPNSFFESKKLDIDLTLSGHTHGGQIVFGESGEKKIALFQPFFPYLKGHYQENGKHLYVNSGLGHWLPMRINCPVEIIQFTLV